VAALASDGESLQSVRQPVPSSMPLIVCALIGRAPSAAPSAVPSAAPSALLRSAGLSSIGSV